MKNTNNIRTRITAGILVAVTAVSAMAITACAYSDGEDHGIPANPPSVRNDDPAFEKVPFPYIDDTTLKETGESYVEREEVTGIFVPGMKDTSNCRPSEPDIFITNDEQYVFIETDGLKDTDESFAEREEVTGIFVPGMKDTSNCRPSEPDIFVTNDGEYVFVRRDGHRETDKSFADREEVTGIFVPGMKDTSNCRPSEPDSFVTNDADTAFTKA